MFNRIKNEFKTKLNYFVPAHPTYKKSELRVFRPKIVLDFRIPLDQFPLNQFPEHQLFIRTRSHFFLFFFKKS